jgi:hypothetical protein
MAPLLTAASAEAVSQRASLHRAQDTAQAPAAVLRCLLLRPTRLHIEGDDHLLDAGLDIGGWQVHFVDAWHQVQPLLKGQEEVGHGLRLDALQSRRERRARYRPAQ